MKQLKFYYSFLIVLIVSAFTFASYGITTKAKTETTVNYVIVKQVEEITPFTKEVLTPLYFVYMDRQTKKQPNLSNVLSCEQVSYFNKDCYGRIKHFAETNKHSNIMLQQVK